MATSGSVQGLLGSGVIPQTTTTSSTQSTTANALDANSFMTMFLTQLKYQDPTNPLESYQLAAQLAQFSSVEKLTQATTLLQNIQDYSVAINNAEMASLVGKSVTAQRSAVDVKTDSVSALNYKLDSAAANVTVAIKDSSGNVVYSESRGSQDAGSYKIEWDGKDSSGNRVSEGAYSVEVQSVDTSGNTAAVRTTVSGTVASLSLDGASPYYVLSGAAGTKVPVSDVLEIATPAASTEQAAEAAQLSNLFGLL
ncbi:MAG: FlgD immunoglobulin-like domain containing protein [Syntrophobacteraceae bacterium]